MSEISAYHEAGHAFVATYLGARVRMVTIDPDWDDGPERHGDTQIEWDVGALCERELAEKAVLVALAGPVAEMIHTAEPYHPGYVAEWSADWSQAWEAAGGLFADFPSRLAYLEQATRELYRLLSRDDFWSALALLVDHLVAHETLEGEQVDEILAEAPFE